MRVCLVVGHDDERDGRDRCVPYPHLLVFVVAGELRGRDDGAGALEPAAFHDVDEPVRVRCPRLADSGGEQLDSVECDGPRVHRVTGEVRVIRLHERRGELCGLRLGRHRVHCEDVAGRLIEVVPEAGELAEEVYTTELEGALLFGPLLGGGLACEREAGERYGVD